MIAAVIQARMASTRFPGKILMPLAGKTMLEWVVDRVARARRIDQLVVATSVDGADDAVAALMDQRGVRCFRGSLEDVLDRVYQAAREAHAQAIVRVTADCPLMDPALLDETVRLFESGKYDYVSNCHVPTFPDGLDVEVFSWTALETAWREAELPSEREHVTPFLYKHPQQFRIGLYRSPVDLSGLRWTVDQPEDLRFVSAVYDSLGHRNPIFGMTDVLDLLKRRPELAALNQGIVRNEGYAASLKRDRLEGRTPRADR